METFESLLEFNVDELLSIVDLAMTGLSSHMLGTAEINGSVEAVVKHDTHKNTITTIKVGTLLSVTISETPMDNVTKLCLTGKEGAKIIPLHLNSA